MALFDIGRNLREYTETCNTKKAEIAELEARYEKLKKKYAKLNTKAINAEYKMQEFKDQIKRMNDILNN